MAYIKRFYNDPDEKSHNGDFMRFLVTYLKSDSKKTNINIEDVQSLFDIVAFTMTTMFEPDIVVNYLEHDFTSADINFAFKYNQKHNIIKPYSRLFTLEQSIHLKYPKYYKLDPGPIDAK
jgi:hypothetical protein